MIRWEAFMNRWIALKNFRRKLADEKYPDKRRVLVELIAKEEQKLHEPDPAQN
jgi:hypothetical protein